MLKKRKITEKLRRISRYQVKIYKSKFYLIFDIS